MTTGKLLWGMTWRGAVWGLGIGFVFSAGYGSLLTFGIVYKSFLPSFLSLPFAIGAPSSIGEGLIALPIMIISGSILGAFFGGPIGFISGTIGGLILGVITRFFLSQSVSTTRSVSKIAVSIISVFYGMSVGLYSFNSAYFNVWKRICVILIPVR